MRTRPTRVLPPGGPSGLTPRGPRPAPRTSKPGARPCRAEARAGQRCPLVPWRLLGLALCLLSGLALSGCARRTDATSARGAAASAQKSSPVPPAQPTETDLRLPKGATFPAFLTSALQIPAPEAAAMTAAARPVFNLRRVRAGNQVSFLRAPDGAILWLRYQTDANHQLTIRPAVAVGAAPAPVASASEAAPAATLTPGAVAGSQPGSWTAVLEPILYQTRVVGVAGTVRDSLFGAVEAAGQKDALAIALADIFGWDLDFYTDPRAGDTFRVFVVEHFLKGRFGGYGPILAAEYDNAGRVYAALRFHDSAGEPAYYTPDGRPMRREFLRSPLKFVALRVTSRFSYDRFHPILKIYRPHLGVDYGAPMGTPVQALGAGTVIRAGWSGGGGREVRIRHPGGFQTRYLHLSRILVRVGEHVAQGERIGLVGMSGLATGPHLDFRFLRDGRFENFEVVRHHLPPAAPVAASLRAPFSALRARWMPQLQSLAPATAVATTPAATGK